MHRIGIIMKKLKLKPQLKEKLKQLRVSKSPIYYSGFCVTDNKNFALFDVPEQFLVDKGFTNVLNFQLTENDLWMLIDRKNQIKISRGNLKVTFTGFGMVDRKHFDLFTSLNPKIEFYPVTEWFGNASNRLFVGLPDCTGKPIGVLKTVT